MSIKLKKHEPPMKSLCLCGSSDKFKHCCFGNHLSISGRSSSKIIGLINEDKLQEALRMTREYITFYTLCHKTNTEPFLKSTNEGVSYLLEIDIKALDELVDLLFECYRKLDQVERFENVCEHLRRNILDHRWQKRVSYYQVLSKLEANNWSNSIGEKEVTKFEPILDENDDPHQKF
ncbi:SEC-C metal-binding domain-containing protein, partial [Vibrio sp. 10N.286.45.F3]